MRDIAGLKIVEVKTDHTDEEENVTAIDVIFEDDLEEYVVVGEICLDTGKVFYRDSICRLFSEITEAVEEVRSSIIKESGSIEDAESRENLIDALISQIKSDIEKGDTTVLAEILETKETQYLKNCLPEEGI
jgi:hypothetical protein